ncbi:MAG: DNA-binding protein [Desulfatibacillum sp.]|nr:DNA-binding protein [Desulfatibacillum sp.]
MTLKEVSQEYGLPVDYWDLRLHAQEIRYIQINNTWCIDRIDIEDFLERIKRGGTRKPTSCTATN